MSEPEPNRVWVATILGGLVSLWILVVRIGLSSSETRPARSEGLKVYQIENRYNGDSHLASSSQETEPSTLARIQGHAGKHAMAMSLAEKVRARALDLRPLIADSRKCG